MSKVYCVTEPFKTENGKPIPLFDLTPATVYGDIEILLSQNQSFVNPAPVIDYLYDKLEAFNENDYILPTGDPTMIMVVGAIAADRNNGRMKILKWDKHQRTYHTIQIDLNGDMGAPSVPN